MHPVHAEAVAGIVGRAEVLAALFILAGLIVLLPRGPRSTVPSPPGWMTFKFAALLFLLALLAKETAICYAPVAVIVLWSVYRRGLTARWWITRVIVLLSPLMIYFPLRFVALEARFVRDRLVSGLFNPLNEAPLTERIVGPFTILGQYTRLTFAPARLSSDYGLAIVNPPGGPDVMTLLGVLSAVGLMALLITPFIRSRKAAASADNSWLGGSLALPRVESGTVLALLTALFVASYVLISNTVLLIGVSLAERLFYWPSVPVLIGVALGALRFWERIATAADAARRARAPLLTAIGALLLLALGARAAIRSADWADNETLFPVDAAAHPEGAHLNCIFGQLRVNQAAHAPDAPTAALLANDAEIALHRALTIAPRFPQALQALGQLHMLRGEEAAARDCLERAIALQPGNALAAAELARLRGTDQATLARATALKEAITTQPGNVAARVELGRALIGLGQNYDALEEFQAADRIAPENVEVLRGLADALILNLQRDDAARVLQRLVAIAPDDWQAHANLTTLLRDTDPKATLEHARRAMELHPDDLRVQVNLAEAIALNGDKDEALRRLRGIEKNLPSDSTWRPIIADRIHDLATRGP